VWSHDYQEARDLGEANFLRNHRTAVESLMQKYGEQMLKVRFSPPPTSCPRQSRLTAALFY
jgi:hypothetical protein